MANQHHAESPKGIWYTYFGEGGAAVMAFLWIAAAITWIFSIVNCG
ncbi:MAG: hypothetical protein ACKO1U_06665 [Bacteroidota bacterium]